MTADIGKAEGNYDCSGEGTSRMAACLMECKIRFGTCSVGNAHGYQEEMCCLWGF